MAVQGPFKVAFGDVFPYGAFVKGGVEAVRDFDRSSKDNFVQARDKDTGNWCGRWRCWTPTRRPRARSR
ncbi:hypothetical protein [Actinomadura bangladeshensis]|uniref:hypothetical protein n=1 Tax=Actinomadura bangladeshensis TaxID=453573 RepID=UPI001943E680|nr:hypothetical protein [Actinomadura bangladeshensis]